MDEADLLLRGLIGLAVFVIGFFLAKARWARDDGDGPGDVGLD